MFDFSRNHFELFGMPVDFEIDLGLLQERYREVQRQVHPDRYASASDQERRLALQFATRVNEAFQTLRVPLSRAQYLLELQGAEPVDGGSVHDPVFLMQQMELREQLAEVRSAPDPLAGLDAQMRVITRMRADLIRQIGTELAAQSGAGRQAAAESVRKLQFLDKLLAEAESLEAELEDDA